MQSSKQLSITFFGILLVAAIACNSTSKVISQTSSIPTFDPNLLGTIIVKTANAAFTQTAQSFPTITATPLATQFRVLEASPTASNLTLSSFKPGDPTATPLGNEITDSNFVAGVEALNNDDYERTVELMSIVIDTNPNLAPPYRYRGISYWSLNKCDLALSDFNQALTISPRYAAAWAGLAITNACLGNETEMLLDYQKALSIDPSLSFVHFNLGVYYYGLKNYQKSLEEYSLSIEIDPSRSGTWSGKAEALHQLGRYDECIESTNKAIEIDVKEWLAYSDRAYCNLELKNYTLAIDDLDIFLANKTTDPAAYSHRGDAYFELQKYDQAIDDYKASLIFSPYNAHAYCFMSLSYFETERYQDSLDAAQASHDIDPNCGGQRLIETEARSYYALGNYDQALEYINKAILMGEYTIGHYYRGIIYQAAGKKQEAIQDMELFLSLVQSPELFIAEITDAKARLEKLKK